MLDIAAQVHGDIPRNAVAEGRELVRKLHELALALDRKGNDAVRFVSFLHLGEYYADRLRDMMGMEEFKVATSPYLYDPRFADSGHDLPKRFADGIGRAASQFWTLSMRRTLQAQNIDQIFGLIIESLRYQRWEFPGAYWRRI